MNRDELEREIADELAEALARETVWPAERCYTMAEKQTERVLDRIWPLVEGLLIYTDLTTSRESALAFVENRRRLLESAPAEVQR